MYLARYIVPYEVLDAMAGRSPPPPRRKSSSRFDGRLFAACPWLLASILLYVFVGCCWLPVVWIHVRLQRLAETAARAGTSAPRRITGTTSCGSDSVGTPFSGCW
jgi:hypothetical protein